MAKAGRKRKIAVKREPNGKPSRAGARLTVEQENMRAAVEYRQKVFGLSAKDAMDQKAATLIGRLCLQGVISAAQWQAAEDWHQLLIAIGTMINGPRGFATPSAGSGTATEQQMVQHWKNVKARFDAANAAIEDHAPIAEKIERMSAMRTFIVDEVDHPGRHGTLRTALNGLVKHFGLEGRKAA